MAALKQAEPPAKPRRPEPDKSAMTQPVAVSEDYGRAAPPSNVGSLKLLNTTRPIAAIIWHYAATLEDNVASKAFRHE